MSNEEDLRVTWDEDKRIKPLPFLDSMHSKRTIHLVTIANPIALGFMIGFGLMLCSFVTIATIFFAAMIGGVTILESLFSAAG